MPKETLITLTIVVTDGTSRQAAGDRIAKLLDEHLSDEFAYYQMDA